MDAKVEPSPSKSPDSSGKRRARKEKAKTEEAPPPGKDMPSFLESEGKSSGTEGSICWAGMHGGMPGTGIRAVAELADRLPSIGRPSVDEFRSPAYVREQYRFGTVSVGPPYHTNEKDNQGSPAWTAFQMLDATLDKNDWRRSYSSVYNKRGGQLGPKESVRTVGRSVSLPRLRVASRPKHTKKDDGKKADVPPSSQTGAGPTTQQEDNKPGRDIGRTQRPSPSVSEVEEESGEEQPSQVGAQVGPPIPDAIETS